MAIQHVVVERANVSSTLEGVEIALHRAMPM